MIRPFGLRDAWEIRHLQPRGVSFDLRRLLQGSSSPASSALLGLVTHHYLGAYTLVHYGPKCSDVRGFVQLEPRRDGQAWDLTYLAPSLDEPQALPGIWHELLKYAIRAGADQRVLRLYARPPQDSEVELLLRRAGFALVGREEIFALSEPLSPVAPPRGFREADRQDVWALRELGRKTIPPLAYQARDAWELEEWPRAALTQGSQSDYVWTDKGEVVAHLRLDSGPRGHWIECVVRPEYRGDLLPHMRYLVSLTNCSPSRPVYFAVPDYTVGLGWLLRTLGFGAYGKQLIMVAHTVSRARVSRPVVATGLESSVDIAAPLSRAERSCSCVCR